MSNPLNNDLRRGIRVWGNLYNLTLGDCVVAGFLHLVMLHSLAAATSWKRLLYRVGFKPPTGAYALSEYTRYLATLDEKPSPTQGIDPNQFFPWAMSQGYITEWQQIVIRSQDDILTAFNEWDGCGLALNLTNRMYDSSGPWIVEPGDSPNPSLGHFVAMVEYGPNYYGVVTWGKMKQMSVAASQLCVNGCWVFR